MDEHIKMTDQLQVKRVTAKLELLRFPAPPLNAVRACCLHCSSPLTLHQPDTQTPERLLGICEECQHWFLIDMLPNLTEGVMVRLPDHQVLRDLSHEDPSGGISLMSDAPEGRSPPPPGSSNEPGRSR
jgi:hypothetical protein